jgi:tRNA(His) 5'-end guanylyltransferase
MADIHLTKRGLGELQKSLERFENYNDGFILPDTYLVLRLDAHRYGIWDAPSNDEYPSGPRITRAFHECATSLMLSSLRIVCAFCHGDEISLFIDPVENNSPLRRSRIISLLSSGAALHFAQASGLTATFEARLAELPSLDRVVQYFYWQRKYSFRNALTIALRRTLQARGLSSAEIESAMHGVTEEGRITKLQESGGDLNSIPRTTRFGSLFWWEREVRNEQEQFRIRSLTELPDSDAEFVDLVTRVVRGRSLIVEKSLHMTRTESETTALDSGATNSGAIDAGMEHSAAPGVSVEKGNANNRRGSRKSNTSVFRV